MQKASGPKHPTTFRDKYLAVIKGVAVLILFSISANSFGQYVPPGYTRNTGAYGNWFKRSHSDSAVHIPNKPCLCTNDRDTTPQLFVFMDTLRLFANGTFRNLFPGGGGGGGSYNADEVSLHLSGSTFSIKSTYSGQVSINTLGTILSGIWQSTPIADAYIASSANWNAKLNSTLNNGYIFVGNGSNVATGVAPSGDISMTNAGAVALTSVVTAGSCTNCNLTYDAKGRITVAANGTGGGSGNPFADNVALVKNNADNTRTVTISAASVATGTNRTLTSPDASGTIDLQNNTATLTNKTLAAGSNTITGLTNANLSGSAGITNANLQNSTITINGRTIALGGSIVDTVRLAVKGTLGYTDLYNSLQGDTIYRRAWANSTTVGVDTFPDGSMRITSLLTYSNSVKITSAAVALENDLSSPGNFKYYGTNGSGTRGWQDYTVFPLATASFPGLLSSLDYTKLHTTVYTLNPNTPYIVGARGDTSLVASLAGDTLWVRTKQWATELGIKIKDSSNIYQIKKSIGLDSTYWYWSSTQLNLLKSVSETQTPAIDTKWNAYSAINPGTSTSGHYFPGGAFESIGSLYSGGSKPAAVKWYEAGFGGGVVVANWEANYNNTGYALMAQLIYNPGTSEGTIQTDNGTFNDQLGALHLAATGDLTVSGVGSWAKFTSGLRYTVTATGVNYTPVIADNRIIATASGITITLPVIGATYLSQEFIISNISTASITIAAGASDNISDGTTTGSITLAAGKTVSVIGYSAHSWFKMTN